MEQTLLNFQQIGHRAEAAEITRNRKSREEARDGRLRTKKEIEEVRRQLSS